MTETCTIVITMRDKMDNHHEEDIVKNLWPYLTPWFTRRHGVENGKITLSDGAIEVDWKYRSDAPPDGDEQYDNMYAEK